MIHPHNTEIPTPAGALTAAGEDGALLCARVLRALPPRRARLHLAPRILPIHHLPVDPLIRNSLPQDPTVGLSLEPYGGRRGWVCFL